MNPHLNSIEVCARAVIKESEGILVCRKKGADYYFFPGGHVEYGEKSLDALARDSSGRLSSHWNTRAHWNAKS